MAMLHLAELPNHHFAPEEQDLPSPPINRLNARLSLEKPLPIIDSPSGVCCETISPGHY